MKTKTSTALCGLISGLLVLASGTIANASINFTFTEVGGDVVMTSSGTLNTANLVSADHNNWGGTGIDHWWSATYDSIGGTDVGGRTDTAFGFSIGTDLSAWLSGNAFTASYFDFVATGTKGFSTIAANPSRPGIALVASQMDGAFWTPDQTWTATGETFASIGLNPGTYTVADNATGESISFQITSVPEPSSALLCLVGIAAIGLRRRRS